MSAPDHEPIVTPVPGEVASGLSDLAAHCDGVFREEGPAANWKDVGIVGASFGIHAVILIVLASILVPVELEEEEFLVLNRPNADEADFDPAVDIVVQPEKLVEGEADDVMSAVEAARNADEPSPVLVDLSDDEIASAISQVEADSVVANLRGEFGGRSEQGKLASLRKFGGTADSERAVSSGLRWLAAIQRKDGSWDFTEVGGAPNPGTLQGGQMGATAMALLCYLGAGHTHASETDYSPHVSKALSYLISNAKFIANEADLRGDVTGNGGMYIQGLATIALCEAHALTRRRAEDKNLKATAQSAIRFIEQAQDKDGGWRYQPREGGDTSVVGWQVMALKSGRAAKLRVKSDSFYGAKRFLTRVQADGGARYGYTGPDTRRPSTTAIGLLCRMYMGWKRDKEPLARGAAYLAKQGPIRDDSYYNYYASQVLHHWGGEEWKQWNEELRPRLVRAQIRKGPATGSWNPVDRHAGQGGRIYETALSIMTLEVYYRHLPLYRRSAVNTEEKAATE